MSLSFTSEDSEYELHEDGEFVTVTLSQYEEIPAEESQFNQAQVKWIFEEDGREFPVWYFTPARLTKSDKSKLRKLLIAFGEDPDSGERIDANDLIGKKVRLLFEHYTKDGSTRERVTNVKAAR